MVFYEAPHKLKATLGDMFEFFGDREIALVREITKIHEQVIRTTLIKACEMYENENPKGEFVIIVSGAIEQEKEITFEQAVKIAREMVEDGMSVNNASKQAAKMTPFKKNDIYKALL